MKEEDQEEFKENDAEDSIAEEVDEDGESFGAGAAALKKLRERLKKAIEEKQEYLDGWQRARAEFANYKRIEEENRKEKTERNKAEIVEKILPLLDIIELARQHDANPTITMLEKQFIASLKELGVERFGQAGEKFDPQRHEPLREIDIDTAELDHMIAKVERSGYAIGDTVIRPAHVALGIYKK